MITETRDRSLFPESAPQENFSRGLFTVKMPDWMGEKTSGKVRDSWSVGPYMALVTTDRQSAFDRVICTVPGKGQVLNKLSQFWFENTSDIIPSHLISVPHPNVLIAEKAQETLPVEVVVRGYMARSATDTSVYRNYTEGNLRTIYGIEFPDGLHANEPFPMGPIITPTTKAEKGEHDQMLNDDEARVIVDTQLGWGAWDATKDAAIKLFQRGSEIMGRKGLVLADTKYEFGIGKNGLMLIDEVHTPDSSRIWLAGSYAYRVKNGYDPMSFDKEIFRSWLADQGFRGDGSIPEVSPSIIDQLIKANIMLYQRITGEKLLGSLGNNRRFSDEMAISQLTSLALNIFRNGRL